MIIKERVLTKQLIKKRVLIKELKKERVLKARSSR